MSMESGTFVRLVTDPSRSGIVQSGEKTTAGMRMVRVKFANGTVSWLPVDNLEPVPDAPPDLTESFSDGRFVAPEWLRRVLTRIRVTGRLSDVVYSMEATETDFYAHQFKPVLKLLRSPTDALLIADEVGLGKTIEAGLIWTELRARLECNRLLVLCPKTLCVKWRNELRMRFGVDAHIVGASDLLPLLKEQGRAGRGFAAVSSMQSLRPPRGWAPGSWGEEEKAGHSGSGDSPRWQLADLLYEAATGDPLVDLLVVDEAHHMRNPITKLHVLGELINAVSTHRIFLSATPIHLRNRDLHSLLRLIDPDTFEYESTLDDLISANEPIIAARDMLMKPNTSLEQIVECIDRGRESGVLAKSKALQLVRDDLIEQPLLDAGTRAEIASRLESVNQMANYVNRTRRRDVEELRILRKPTAPVLDMNEDERSFYGAVTSEVAEYATEKEVSAGFLLATPQRLLTSSLAAASAYWAGVGESRSNDVEETDGDLHSKDLDDRPLLTRLKKLTKKLDKTAQLEKSDTKFEMLTRELNLFFKEEPGAKVIVFSSFKPTLIYLRRRLEQYDIGCELLHGSIHDSREAVLERFKERKDVRVLLSSEVGSEGVDLQFSRIVINYDLPWNPMRLEQRVGRVDRLGQKCSQVSVLNLIHSGTIDAEIYLRLYQRLELSERALGEFEPVLGEPIREMTQKLLDPKLSEEEKKRVIEQTAQAIENRRLEEDFLEKEAGSLIRHGDYVLEKIRERHERHQWLAGDDILTYVKDRLDRSFSGCRIEASSAGSDTYRIILSSDAYAAFVDFMARRRLPAATGLMGNGARQRYRFTSSVAQRSENGVEPISRLHGLVQFAGELDGLDRDAHESQPVAAAVGREHLKDCEPGIYVVGIRRWQAIVPGHRAGSETQLTYVGADLEKFDLISPEVAEAMAGVAAVHGRPLPNFASDGRLSEAVKLLNEHVLPELDRLNGVLHERKKADIEDRATIREQALVRHLRKKTEDLTLQRDRHQWNAMRQRELGNERLAQRLSALANATAGTLRRLQDRLESRLKEIQRHREYQPEFSDVTYILIEVKGGRSQ